MAELVTGAGVIAELAQCLSYQPMIEKTLPKSCGTTACMIASDDCQSYLQEICHRYEQWWTENALTDAIAARQSTFSFEQMVQTEEKDSEGKPKKIPPLPIFKAIQNYIKSEHILLVGSPGVGKSTALWGCLVQLAEGEREKPTPRIPVLISLKRYNSDRFSCPEDPSGILTLIKDTLEPDLWLEVSDIKKLLFKDKRLILLLDGLNEMSAGEKRTELEEFRKKCDRAKVPLICTTRELGGGDLGIKRRLEIQPLRGEEVERFLQDCIPDQVQKVSQLVNRDNRELSRTPFVLWMLYDLLQKQGTEIETLAEAFRQFFQSFKKYKEDAPVSDERRQEWNRWLEHLAFTMLNHPDPTDPGLVIFKEQAEKSLIEKFGDLYGASSRIEELLKYHLLEAISEKEISFHHQLIQEYYAAECLLTQLPDLLKKQPKQKYTPFQMNYLNYVKWTEAIAIVLGLLNSEVKAVQVVKLALEVDLLIGARLAGEVTPELQEKTVSLVAELITSQRHNIYLLGITRSEKAVLHLQKIFEDGDFSTRWSVIDALGQIGNDAGIPLLQEAMTHKECGLGRKAIEALGRIASEKAISLLSLALSDSDINGNAVNALVQIGNKAAMVALREAQSNPNMEDYVRSKIKNNTDDMLPSLLQQLDNEEDWFKALKHSDFFHRSSAIHALEHICSEATACNETTILALCEALKDEYSWVSFSAVQALGHIKSEDSIFPLLQLLNHETPDVRINAACALGSIGSKKAVPTLIQALSDDNAEVRYSVAMALGEIASNEALPALIKTASQDISKVRTSAIQALGKIDNKDLIPTLIEFSKDIDSNIRASAISTLGDISSKMSEPIVKILQQILVRDPSPRVRQMSVEALRKIGNEAVPALCHALTDKDITVRVDTVQALGRIRSRDAIPKLSQALKDTNSHVRKSAAYALGAIGGENAICTLCQFILGDDEQTFSIANVMRAIDSKAKISESDEYFYAYYGVFDALQTIENPLLLPPMIQKLQVEETDLIEDLIKVISTIQSRCGFYNYEIAQLSLQNQLDVDQKQLSQGVPNVTNNFNFDQRGATIGVNVASEGSNIKFIQHAKQNINISEQDLAEAAQKIQALLNQLAQSYPTTDEVQQQTFVQKFLEWAESTPDMIKVLLAGGIEGLKVLCPPAGIPVEMARRLYEAVQERHNQT